MSNKQQNHSARNVGSRTTINRYYYIYLIRRFIHHEVSPRISWRSWFQLEFTGKNPGAHRIDGEVGTQAGQ